MADVVYHHVYLGISYVFEVTRMPVDAADIPDNVHDVLQIFSVDVYKGTNNDFYLSNSFVVNFYGEVSPRQAVEHVIRHELHWTYIEDERSESEQVDPY